MPLNVCSSIQHQLKEVLGTKIGICAREIELVEVSTGKRALDKKVNVEIDDRFKLKIPVSDQYMTWEVVFNCSLPNCPPDFDLNDIDFFYSLSIDSVERLLPTLTCWDHTKDNALINVITELRSAYLKYQAEMLKTVDNRSAHEYSSLINEREMPDEQVEVLVEPNTIHFLIGLNVMMPRVLFNSDEQTIALAVKCTTHGRSANLITTSNGTGLELQRNINGEESLLEYVDEMNSSIQKQILDIVFKYETRRKHFIFELLKVMGNSVISWDALEYKYGYFLVEKDGFVAVLEVLLKPKFPDTPPRYKFISAYSHAPQGQVFTQRITLPFSHTKDTSTMVKDTLMHIKNRKIEDFRDTTVSNFRFFKYLASGV